MLGVAAYVGGVDHPFTLGGIPESGPLDHPTGL